MYTNAHPSTVRDPSFLPDMLPEDVADKNFAASHKADCKEGSELLNNFPDTGTAGNAEPASEEAKRTGRQSLAFSLKRTMEGYTQNPRLLQCLEEYRAIREGLEKPLTEEALLRILRKLDRLSQGDEYVKAALLEQSVKRCWTGIFPLRNPVFTDDFQTSAERRLEVDTAAEHLTRKILFSTRYEE